MDFREALLAEMQKSKNKLTENKKIVKESKVEEDTEEYLEPRFDSRASFYKKAKVVKKDNGDEELYSYDTLVGGIKDGKPYSKGKFSQTTSRHQKEYFTQKGYDPKKVDVVENCEKKEAGKKLTEDSYEEPIFQSVEEALREYGFDVTRFNDAGVLTKNLGWIIENEAGELEITCDGTYLDESKKLTERKNGVEGIKDIVNNRIAPDLDLVIELADEIKDQNPKYEGFVNVAEDCKSNIVHGLAEITDYLNEGCGRNCGTKKGKKVTESDDDAIDQAYNYLEDVGLGAADLLLKVAKFFGQDQASDFAYELLSNKDENKKVGKEKC